MRRTLTSALALALALAAQPALSDGVDLGAPEPAVGLAQDDGFGDLVPMDLAELEAERGGILTPFGYEVGFGAVMKTLVGGQVALETHLTWTDTGPFIEKVVGDALSSADLKVLAATAGIQIGDRDFTNTGFVPGPTGGGTAIIHDFGDGHIANMLMNTASSQDIQVVTNVTLILPQFEQMQQDMLGQQLANNIADTVTNAILSGLR